jgi:hypothetical protein
MMAPPRGGLPVRTCSRCVLPETAPGITFDGRGICSYCQSYRKTELRGEEAFLKILDRYRGKGAKYDCIIGISGGRDSSYTLLKLAKDYRMRVLALNYDNPFTDPQAAENMRRAADILGVDVIRYRLPNRIHERTFRHNLLAWLEKPNPAMVPMLCIACKNFIPPLIRYAKEYGITCVVMGGSPFEIASFKRELISVSRDADYQYTWISGLKGIMKNAIKNLTYFHPMCIPIMVKGFFYGDPYSLGPRLFAPRIRFYHLFDYIPWKEEEIISRISRELNWSSPRNLHSTWRFDCKVSHLKDLLYLKTLKMTEKDDLYAKLVREGHLTREEALERLIKENLIYEDEIRIVLDRVGLGEDILERVKGL